ncbi:MAG: esterase-like activity of phytase family protein [Pseudomonadota bacterium]
MKQTCICLLTIYLAACAGAADDKSSDPEAIASDFDQIGVSALLPDIRARSCSEDGTFVEASPILISSEPLPLGGDEATALTGARFAGAWHLTSEEPNFGGLSGLAPLSGGNLLAVSDAGAFVWIDMEDGVPASSGHIGYMRGEDGSLLRGKRQSDSEGVTVVDGVALVSFERDHRILGFALEACGINAGGVLVTDITDTPDGLPQGFRSNQGAEALMVDKTDALIAGLETGRAGPSVSAVSALTKKGMRFDQRLARPNGPFLVGLEGEGDTMFGLFRSYAPAIGNLIEVRSYGGLEDDGRTRIRLSRPYTVDNFEGIATVLLENGRIRLYIISDDNFSARQRTLLMAFDLDAVEPAAP